MNGAPMNHPPEDGEKPPLSRAVRLLGLLAALGFSLAMWAFIALAVLGLILKIAG